MIGDTCPLKRRQGIFVGLDYQPWDMYEKKFKNKKILSRIENRLPTSCG